MTPVPDASFLVSLYGVDVNAPIARAWMVKHEVSLLVSQAQRFEAENALRLACFRGQITGEEMNQSLNDIEMDFALGILLARDVHAKSHWSECRRISAAHTLATGARAYDITHVAAALLLKADTFLTFDTRQRALAVAEGLAVAP